jgi:hypothetical protein
VQFIVIPDAILEMKFLQLVFLVYWQFNWIFLSENSKIPKLRSVLFKDVNHNVFGSIVSYKKNSIFIVNIYHLTSDG